MLSKEPITVFILPVLLLIGQACKKEDEIFAPDPINNADWHITGRLNDENYAQGTIIAVFGDGTQRKSTISDELSFSFTLPQNSVSALHFFPGPESSESKSSSAILSFSEEQDRGMRDTLRLAKPTPLGSLNLGTVSIKGEFAYPSMNPALRLDFDQDGIADAKDRDDDNNGILDVSENDQSVLICHQKESTLAIELSSLLPHLMHEDVIGRCKQ